jgi:succinate dehydrogenase / fumarate reductase, iron-sulfur subunit
MATTLDTPPQVAHRQDDPLMRLTVKVWRQGGPDDAGRFATYEHTKVSPHMSFLEMLDVLNEELIDRGEEPIAFDHDCREGICGSCGMMINGVAHGPERATATCQLHMRHFKDGDTVTIEPWRARAFPVIKDLVVDRGALDRIVEAGGYISAPTGSAPDANAILVPKQNADRSFDAAACIQCGACVAACPNASAMLFLAAKQSHLGLLPQGQPERYTRTVRMVEAHDAADFGGCTNLGECTAACPKEISQDFIARLNRDLIRAKLSGAGSATGGT